MTGRNIVLIGMPGAGKTTLGNYLSKKLGIPFLDTDIFIEQTAGRSVMEIFARSGEDGFRLIEREVIRKASTIRNIIIATGGGAWTDSSNRKSLTESGRVVYLNCSLNELWNRLKNSQTTRPLLKGGFESLQKLYNKRHGEYMLANYIIDTTGKSVEETGDELINTFGLNRCDENAAITMYNGKVSFGDRDYDIIIGVDILKKLGSFLEKKYLAQGVRPRLLILTNPFLNALCGDRTRVQLEEAGFNVSTFIVPEGETSKTLECVQKIYTYLVGKGFERGDVVIALGGGVIGDLAGFAAATYMRGMRLVQLPTTLLAQVDSSIGGKTAVNLPEGKNLVGAFHHPDLVVSDTGLLRHLSQHDYRQGLAECVKYGLIDQDGLFKFLEENISAIIDRESEVLSIMVRRCCDIKGGIVQKDEREYGVRKLLNLGHTVGHALEAAAGYGDLGHGDAVALGIRAKAYIGLKLGFMDERDYKRIINILNTFGFPSNKEFSLNEVLKFITRDKKKKAGKLWFVMPKGIGSAEVVTDIPETLLAEGLKIIGSR